MFGLVEKPIGYSLSNLQSMNKQTQVTEHFCIQGWTAIAEWGGVPMNDIIASCKPCKDARYIVFYSYQITDGDEFYEVLDLEIAKHKQTILAYEMNGKPRGEDLEFSQIPFYHSVSRRFCSMNYLFRY